MIIKAFESCDTLKRSIALGSFDGVHIAHKEVILSAVNYAKENDCISAVVTFRQPPALILGQSFSLISQNELKEKYIEELGVDELIYIDFNREFCSLSPTDFFKILKAHLDAVSLSCGFNYRFGSKKSGDSKLLQKLCKENRINFSCSPPILFEDEAVSSTRIRKLIEQGDISKANLLLGHPFGIKNTVVDGQHLGRKLRFPTANQSLPKNCVVPRFGVYITRAEIDGKIYNSVSNIGNRPTVDGSKVLCETNIFGFSGNIYGKEIKVEFHEFLRDEEKFSSVDDLKNNVYSDIASAQRYFNNFE